MASTSQTSNVSTSNNTTKSSTTKKTTSKEITNKTTDSDFLGFQLEPDKDKAKSETPTEQVLGDRPTTVTINPAKNPTSNNTAVNDNFPWQSSSDRSYYTLKNYRTLTFSGRGERGTGGDDYAVGSDRDDTFSGNDGDDVIFGLRGDDWLFGNDQKDSLNGGNGEDYLFGGRDDDQLNGEDDDDLIYGNRGDDWLWGEKDNDTLYGGQGDDTLSGGKGRDLLTGDFGEDILSGGVEADAFVLRSDAMSETRDRADIITDFDLAEGDRLYILGTFNPADLLAVETMVNFGTVKLDGRDVPLDRPGVQLQFAPTGHFFGIVSSQTETVTRDVVLASLSIISSPEFIQIS